MGRFQDRRSAGVSREQRKPMIEYSEDLKFWLRMEDLTRSGGLAPEQNKKRADLILQERPAIVFETGVFTGSSTVTILECLKQLDHGILYSVDDESLIKKFTCCFVTDDLKKNWAYLKMKSDEAFETFKDDFKIDIFLHDSDHSAENMKFEFNWAYQHINNNGWIVSHDTHNNSAWDDFCETVNDNVIESFKVLSLCGVRIKK